MVNSTPLPNLPNTRECNRTGNHVKTKNTRALKIKLTPVVDVVPHGIIV
jgi:hypothetical protein